MRPHSGTRPKPAGQRTHQAFFVSLDPSVKKLSTGCLKFLFLFLGGCGLEVPLGFAGNYFSRSWKEPVFTVWALPIQWKALDLV